MIKAIRKKTFYDHQLTLLQHKSTIFPHLDFVLFYIQPHSGQQRKWIFPKIKMTGWNFRWEFYLFLFLLCSRSAHVLVPGKKFPTAPVPKITPRKQGCRWKIQGSSLIIMYVFYFLYVLGWWKVLHQACSCFLRCQWWHCEWKLGWVF